MLALSDRPIPALPDSAHAESPISGTIYGHCRNKARLRPVNFHPISARYAPCWPERCSYIYSGLVCGMRASISVSTCDQTCGSHSIAVCPLNMTRLYHGYA